LTLSPSVQTQSHTIRILRSKQDYVSGSMRIYLAQSPNLHHRLLQVMHHMYALQISMSQTLQFPQAAPNPQAALEFHIHGFHQAAPRLPGIYSDPHDSL